ncbi:MAG: class I SAM-dependent methyltransferase [Deltaproteobacteria bacterium]|nr:class I SAM-dependent methyltransferase [Deltaproteobacteria bacterium]
MKILDVGCGKNKTAGAVGMDMDRDSAAEIIHDLDVFPYPLPDNEFDLLICSHIIEHVADVKGFLDELRRIAKPNAIIRGITPHFSNPCGYYDPTHRHYFGFKFLEFFAEGNTKTAGGFFFRAANRLLECYYPIPRFSKEKNFRLLKTELYFPRVLRLMGVSAFSNNFPEMYEFYLSGVFRARDIIFELQVLK